MVAIYASAISNLTVLSGGTVNTNNAGIYGNVDDYGVMSGGNVYGTLTVNSGVVIVSTGASAAGEIVSSGGILSALNGATLGTNILENGGSAILYADNGGSIDLEGTGNGGLVISGLISGGTVTTVISGFDGTSIDNSDIITLAGVSAESITNVSYSDADHIVFTITNSDRTTSTITLNIIGIEASGYNLGTNKDGSVTVEVCFLARSMIRIPGGEIAVENLRTGDLVCTYDWENNQEVTRRISWIGYKSTKVRVELPDDMAGYPVRILKDSVANNVPYKDLLVTPEHCLFFDGKFVPVRMLVNGTSICYDYSITEYTYYHIETEEHSVIWANALLTESYLDTGNRADFRQLGDFAIFANRYLTSKNWEVDARAPLAVNRANVEPFYNQLMRQAAYIGYTDHLDTSVTDDSDLHLITTSQKNIRWHFKGKNKYIFMLPRNVSVVYLKSKASRPCDAISPFIDDRRTLGVLVSNISIITANQHHNLTEHLTSEELIGWDAIESTSYRWTNGYATLNVAYETETSSRILVIEVLDGGPYLIEEKESNIKIA